MPDLPVALRLPIMDALARSGDTTPLQRVRSIGGGCINNALRLDTAQLSYLLKWHSNPPQHIFTTEMLGLQLLASVGTVRVPDVIAFSEVTEQYPGFLLMEWIEPARRSSRHGNEALLGEQLAMLHKQGASPHYPPAYGLDHNNYIGTTPQINSWETNWVTFFRDYRLRPQIVLAEHNNYLSILQRRNLDRLLVRLDELLGGVERQPALLHGDLWSGNVIAGPQGEPVLIDPAVYYGDREAELAYTELFGGFGRAFYEAYEATWPTAPDRALRRDVYNLYHLLNHLNLFGTMYSVSIDQVLSRYV